MNTYSSGMGARLRFAISTAAAPDVLMIDEALATGDADFRAKSAERITRIREQAGTVFLVSHSNGNIRQICDRVLWMDQGRLIADGPTDEVLPLYEATLPKRSKKKAAPLAEPEVPGTRRFGGESRVDVATSLSRHTWEPGVEGAFVVSVHKVATARVVAPIAARLGWPLLWVRPGSVPSATRDELRRLGELVADAHVGRVLDALAVARQLAGHDPGAVSSVRKLIGVAHRQSVPEFGLDLLGVDGVGASDAADQLLQNRCLSIAGGTEQVLLNVVGERILGLVQGLGDRDALAGGKPVGLDHDRCALLAHVGQRGVHLGVDRVVGGDDVADVDEILGQGGLARAVGCAHAPTLPPYRSTAANRAVSGAVAGWRASPSSSSARWSTSASATTSL